MAVNTSLSCTARNTRYLTTLLVPFKDTLADLTLIHHSSVVSQTSKNGFEVWWTYQEWGSFHGPASAYLEVPRRVVINLSPSSEQPFEFPPLPANVSEWPTKLQPKSKDFATPFAAGYLDSNPTLMKSALAYFDEKDTSELSALGLPTTKDALQKLIDAIETSMNADLAFSPRKSRKGILQRL